MNGRLQREITPQAIRSCHNFTMRVDARNGTGSDAAAEIRRERKSITIDCHQSCRCQLRAAVPANQFDSCAPAITHSRRYAFLFCARISCDFPSGGQERQVRCYLLLKVKIAAGTVTDAKLQNQEAGRFGRSLSAMLAELPDRNIAIASLEVMQQHNNAGRKPAVAAVIWWAMRQLRGMQKAF